MYLARTLTRVTIVVALIQLAAFFYRYHKDGKPDWTILIGVVGGVLFMVYMISKVKRKQKEMEAEREQRGQ